MLFDNSRLFFGDQLVPIIDSNRPRVIRKKRRKKRRKKKGPLKGMPEDILLRLVMLLLNKEKRKEKTDKKPKKPRSMRRVGGKGRSVFETPSQVRDKRLRAEKLARREAERVRKPGEDDETYQLRQLRADIVASEDPLATASLYQLTGSLDLGNYEGGNLKQDVAYIGRVVSAYNKPDLDFAKKRALDERLLEIVMGWKGGDFEKKFNPVKARGDIKKGVGLGDAFINKLFQQDIVSRMNKPPGQGPRAEQPRQEAQQQEAQQEAEAPPRRRPEPFGQPPRQEGAGGGRVASPPQQRGRRGRTPPKGVGRDIRAFFGPQQEAVARPQRAPAVEGEAPRQPEPEADIELGGNIIDQVIGQIEKTIQDGPDAGADIVEDIPEDFQFAQEEGLPVVDLEDVAPELAQKISEEQQAKQERIEARKKKRGDPKERATQLVDSLLETLTEAGGTLDLESQKQEIKQTFADRIQRGGTSAKPSSIRKSFESFKKKVEQGKSILPKTQEGETARVVLGPDSLFQKSGDLAYTVKDTGEVISIKDAYPRIVSEIETLDTGGRTRRRKGEGGKSFKQQKEDLDRDLKFSLKARLEGKPISREGYTEDAVEGDNLPELLEKYNSKLPAVLTTLEPGRLGTGKITHVGPKGITIMNEQGYSRFIETQKEPEPEKDLEAIAEGLQIPEERPPTPEPPRPVSPPKRPRQVTPRKQREILADAPPQVVAVAPPPPEVPVVEEDTQLQSLLAERETKKKELAEKKKRETAGGKKPTRKQSLANAKRQANIDRLTARIEQYKQNRAQVEQSVKDYQEQGWRSQVGVLEETGTVEKTPSTIIDRAIANAGYDGFVEKDIARRKRREAGAKLKRLPDNRFGGFVLPDGSRYIPDIEEQIPTPEDRDAFKRKIQARRKELNEGVFKDNASEVETLRKLVSEGLIPRKYAEEESERMFQIADQFQKQEGGLKPLAEVRQIDLLKQEIELVKRKTQLEELAKTGDYIGPEFIEEVEGRASAEGYQQLNPPTGGSKAQRQVRRQELLESGGIDEHRFKLAEIEEIADRDERELEKDKYLEQLRKNEVERLKLLGKTKEEAIAQAYFQGDEDFLRGVRDTLTAVYSKQLARTLREAGKRRESQIERRVKKFAESRGLPGFEEPITDTDVSEEGELQRAFEREAEAGDIIFGRPKPSMTKKQVEQFQKETEKARGLAQERATTGTFELSGQVASSDEGERTFTFRPIAGGQLGSIDPQQISDYLSGKQLSGDRLQEADYSAGSSSERSPRRKTKREQILDRRRRDRLERQRRRAEGFDALILSGGPGEVEYVEETAEDEELREAKKRVGIGGFRQRERPDTPPTPDEGSGESGGGSEFEGEADQIAVLDTLGEFDVET